MDKIAIQGKKLITDDEILNAIKMLRENKKSFERERAFADLRETFNPLIFSKYNLVKNIGENIEEKNNIKEFIESTFSEILLSPQLNLSNPAEVKSYLKQMIGFRVNNSTVEEELGKSSPIKGLRLNKYTFQNALKRYHEKYHKSPDFKNERDLAAFAEIMDVDPDEVIDALTTMGQSTVKSLFSGVADDYEGNIELLIDTLKSDEPLPDQVTQDAETMRAFLDEVQRMLPPDERRVIMEYYHPQDDRLPDLTKDEIARKLKNLSTRQVIHLLNKGKEKLLRSPKLRSLYYSSMKNKFVKYAMSAYKYTIRISEDIITDVMKKNANII